MAKQIRSKRGLHSAYKECSKEVREHFPHVPKLIDGFPLDVALAYVFAKLELGQNLALYCGAVKVHKADSQLAWTAIDSHHMTRDGYLERYKTVFDIDPPKVARDDLKRAEKARDAVMHGKEVSDDQLRNAIAAVLWYAEEINKQLSKTAGLKPFCASLKGFKGRAKSLDKKTSRWLLKGMGFSIN